jgi:hypothetical protein
MKQLNEVARMQQLVGINEIKIKNPLSAQTKKISKLYNQIGLAIERLNDEGDERWIYLDDKLLDIGDEYDLDFKDNLNPDDFNKLNNIQGINLLKSLNQFYIENNLILNNKDRMGYDLD